MTLLELTLETAINEAGEFKDVRLSKEDAEYILTLLKEQEPKTVIKDIYGNAYCPHCSTEKTVEMMAMKLHVGTNFCPYCGRAVKWNDC